MTIQRAKLIYRALALALLSGCASSRVGSAAGESLEGSDTSGIVPIMNYISQRLDSLPPLAFDGPIFYARNPDLQAVPTPLPAWIEERVDGGVNAPVRSSEGYRIQLYSGREKLTAKRIEEEAMNRVGLPVYLNYEAPQYKVRVGNFNDREQAMKDCERLRHLGFSEAWVVRTTITVLK